MEIKTGWVKIHLTYPMEVKIAWVAIHFFQKIMNHFLGTGPGSGAQKLGEVNVLIELCRCLPTCKKLIM